VTEVIHDQTGLWSLLVTIGYAIEGAFFFFTIIMIQYSFSFDEDLIVPFNPDLYLSRGSSCYSVSSSLA